MALLACTGLAGAVLPASAQVVQRSFVNPSFERPYIDTTNNGCHRTVPATWVPGWSSTEAGSNATGFNSGCPTGGTWAGAFPQTSTPEFPITTGATPNMIQMFHQTLGGVNAVEGVQWAELNADQNARLYQQVCMANGERVVWALSHRARGNTVNPEVMEFNIGTAVDGTGSTLIVRASEVTNGTQGTPTAAAPARLCPTTVGGLPATCSFTENNTTG